MIKTMINIYIFRGLRYGLAVIAALLLCVTQLNAAATVSGDARLDKMEIKVDGGNIVTGFTGNGVDYTMEVEKKLPAYATFSAVPVAPDAVVSITLNGENLTNHSLGRLTAGENNVTVTVRSGSEEKRYTIKITAASNNRTIYFKGTSDWTSTPSVYIYTSGTSTTEHAGTWPGTAMTEATDGWYSYILPDAAGTDAQVIFSSNGNSPRYPADNAPGIYLDFEGNSGWYLLSDNKWYERNPEGPQKPQISVNPVGGKLRGSSVINIGFSQNPESVSGSFNGRDLNLSTTSVTILRVEDYLTNGETATLRITATNSEGAETFTSTYTRDDDIPEVTLTGDWRELSIYQIMVGSFQHSDNSSATGYTDMWGPSGHRKNGNLKGITEALDYIKDLGMNAIWMTPIFDSSNGGNGDEKLKATGYFANNFFAIDPHFGSDEEFRELVSEAHARGIYVILDGVFGHHSNCTGASPNGNYIDIQTNVPNVRNDSPGNIAYPGSLNYFKEVVRYWMDNYEVDGWRLDQCYQVYQNGHNYWKDIREEVEKVCNERKARGEQWGTLGFMVGEDWTSAGNVRTTDQDGLKSVMDFDAFGQLTDLGYGVGTIGWLLTTPPQDRGYASGVNPTVFLSNHDTSRIGDSQNINTEAGLKGLMTRHAAVACFSGPVCTYYGDEIGDVSGNGNSDNKARTTGRLTGFNTNEQRLHDFVAQVFKIRSENPALWRGTVAREEFSNGTVQKITKTDAVTGNKVIVIFSSVDANVSIGGTGIDLLTGNSVSNSVNVSAWSPAFIKMQ